MWTEWRKKNYDFFERFLSIKQGVLVDLGAGERPFDKLTKHFKVIAVDHRQNAKQTIDIVADITKPLPLPDECCDVVLLFNVLEHIKEPLMVLKESHRLLKPGGMIIGTAPFLIEIHQAPFDYGRYTNYWLKKAGFKEQSIWLESIGTDKNTVHTMLEKFFDRSITHQKGLTYIYHRLIRKIVFILVNQFTCVSQWAVEGHGFLACKENDIISDII